MRLAGAVDLCGGGSEGRYPSELTDGQGALVEPLLPPARVSPKRGRREKHPRRRIVDAIFSVVRTVCGRRQLPKDRHQVKYQYTVGHGGKVEHIHDALRGKVREADGRDAEPSAGLIDSQFIRTADTGPAATRGFDAGKKVKGRKRFIVTDALGLLLALHVVAASIQDRDGAKRPLLWTGLDHPDGRTVWADEGFASRLVEWTGQILGRDLEISSARNTGGRPATQPGPRSLSCPLVLLARPRRGRRLSSHCMNAITSGSDSGAM
ncbi:transposase [Streptomyces sp. NPDC057131]|uniref:transposase n=1 Tax=Streptomyces sp. NPDC057131 TaxID=3346027 RepID=UPI00363AAAC7